MTPRDQLLFGTTEAVVPAQALAAGPLGFQLDGGNVRYVTWHGAEVLRAISFIVRDSGWGTYAPVLTGFAISRSVTSIGVAYHGRVDGPEGDVAFDVRIAASADGVLTFEASGLSRRGFTTNRTGFVVLHGLAGVTGRDVEVTHASGSAATTRFPTLVSPGQPIFDIRALRHSPAPGITTEVTMEGETYEMEDQRNWTDASYKTYIRPLSKGYPYRIAPGESFEQRVTLRISETEANAVPAEARSQSASPSTRVAPQIGLALSSWDDAAPVPVNYLVGRLDLTHNDPLPQRPFADVTDLDVIISGVDPATELAPLTALSFAPRRLLVVPRRDMASRATETHPRGEASYDEIVAAARRLFPHAAIGGGSLVGFPELNRNRPALGIDFVAHPTSAIVHAADDVSVIETHEALASIVATARSFAGDARYRLGPATIAALPDFYPSRPAGNPDNRRMPAAATDPRQRGLFAAAFAIGYAVTAAGEGVDALTLGCTSGPGAIARPDGILPIGHAIAWLAGIAGQRVLKSGRDSGVASIEVEGQRIVANLTAVPKTESMPGYANLEILDAESLVGGGARRGHLGSTGDLVLDSYAVCRALR